MHRARLLACAAVFALTVSGCSGGPDEPADAAPSASASTLDGATDLALVLAESSYRFSIAFTTPARDIGDFEMPKEDGKVEGVADGHAGVLRAKSESGLAGALHKDSLVIGDQAWQRIDIGGTNLKGWMPTLAPMALNGLHPWRIPAALESAKNVAADAGGYTGTLDLTADPAEGLASYAMQGSDVDVTAVPFTLTLDGEGRPAAFRFEAGEGALSVAFEFSGYGIAVKEEPPSVDELAEPPVVDVDPDKIVCVGNDGKVVPCKD